MEPHVSRVLVILTRASATTDTQELNVKTVLIL